MIKFLFLSALLFLTACTGEDITTAEKPRIIDKIEVVEFIASHEEAEILSEDERIHPEFIDFELASAMSQNQIELKIEVKDEELILGSTHFRLEFYNGEEWVQIENIPYGAEDAQAIVTNAEPFEHTFYDVDQFETDFDTGVYRFVNSGYTFPFYVYVVD